MISKFIYSARKVVPMPENRYLNIGGIEIFTYDFSQKCFTWRILHESSCFIEFIKQVGEKR